ncbi:MAG: conserved membrane protein of unknown function [Candidatus Thorarchaeota archaeon]|nr:MAG: conserved membrane protein of unknown function [Candidatus Thorarchaeota archaeon]
MNEHIEVDISIKLNIGDLIRNSAILLFVIQILSVIFMIGSIGAVAVGSFLPTLTFEFEILLYLLLTALVIMGFLLAIGVFIRINRRITKNIVREQIDDLDIESGKVKLFLYLYGIMAAFLGLTGIYGWFLVETYYFIPWALTLPPYASLPFQIFGISLGALIISSILLLAIIIEGKIADNVFVDTG